MLVAKSRVVQRGSNQNSAWRGFGTKDLFRTLIVIEHTYPYVYPD